MGFGFEDVAYAEVDEGGGEGLLDWCAVNMLVDVYVVEVWR
jgi:hypothetical protein